MSSTRRHALPLALAVLLAPWPGHGQTTVPPQFELRSVSIDLPDGNSAFAPGPGVEVVNGNCVACHSTGMVLNQPALSKAAWEAEVNKMITVYKAPVAAEDVPAIVAYLDRIKGTR